MSAWADGLYDNDAALEVLDNLANTLELEQSPAHFATGLGLIAWLMPRALGTPGVQDALRGHPSWIAEQPRDARDLLNNLLEDPAAFTARKSRNQELLSILGSREDGPREDALLKIEGAQVVIEGLAEECCALLDRGSSDWPDVGILAGEFAWLGPLLELRALSVTTPRDRLESWREAFEQAAVVPYKRHGASVQYVENVKKAFALLGV